jgi:Tfp pilus assembly protein FimT
MGNPKKLLSLTLVELVVAMAITILLLGGAISFFTRDSARRDLEDQGKLVATFIERARNYALNPDTANPSNSGEDALAYAVKFNAEQSIVIARKDKGSTQFVAVSGEKLILSTDYKFINFQPIVFTAGTSRYESSSPADVRIEKKSQTTPYAIVKVSDPGGVDVKVFPLP